MQTLLICFMVELGAGRGEPGCDLKKSSSGFVGRAAVPGKCRFSGPRKGFFVLCLCLPLPSSFLEALACEGADSKLSSHNLLFPGTVASFCGLQKEC